MEESGTRWLFSTYKIAWHSHSQWERTVFQLALFCLSILQRLLHYAAPAFSNQTTIPAKLFRASRKFRSRGGVGSLAFEIACLPGHSAATG